MGVPSMKAFAAAIDKIDEEKINRILREDAEGTEAADNVEEIETITDVQEPAMILEAHGGDEAGESGHEDTGEFPTYEEVMGIDTDDELDAEPGFETIADEEPYFIDDNEESQATEEVQQVVAPVQRSDDEMIDAVKDILTETVKKIIAEEKPATAEEQQITGTETPYVASIDLQEEFSAHITRSELAQRVVDSVFTNYELASINVSYFGDLAVNMLPQGYYVQTVGKHSFFIREATSVPLGSIVSLLDKIRSGLKTNQTMQLALTYPRNLEGSTMHALIITEREIKEIIKSFPDLKFAYTDYNSSIEKVKLVVTTRR